VAPDQPVTGFDTGPGNCLMDGWVKQHCGQAYDADGAFATQGQAIPSLLQSMLTDPYFDNVPPKSTGTDYFSAGWLQGHLSGTKHQAADVQATLVDLTAQSISAAIKRHAPATQRVLVCGGGSHNPLLMAALQTNLACPVETTAAYGIDPDWVEAVAFAWLARETLHGRPGNLPSVTGARGPRILGAIHPA